MDYYLFSLINGLALRWPLLDLVGIFFARTAIFLLPLFAFINFNSALATLARMSASAGIAFVINAGVGLISFRGRPFTVHEVHQLVSIHFTNTKSFPSDHTAVSFAVAVTFALAYPRVGALALVVALLIGLSRVFVGVHYPFDILAGMVVGILSAFAVHLLAPRLGIL